MPYGFLGVIACLRPPLGGSLTGFFALLGVDSAWAYILPLAVGVWFWGTGAAVVAWTLVQKFGEPQKS